MRRSHFEALRPVCPRCRLERQLEVPLVLATVAEEERDVIVEGVLIGLISWLLGAILALPIGQVMAEAVGMQTLNSSLTYAVSTVGILLWLVLVVVISAVASFFPAQQAADLSVREVLAYEQ